MRKSYLFISIAIFLLMLVIVPIIIKFINYDTNNIERIQEEFNRKYTTAFTYIEKYRNDAGKTIYCFAWKENDSIVVRANLEWTFDTILTFLPKRIVKDNFSEALKEFIVTSTCGGLLNITDDGIKTTGQVIYNLMREVRKQMSIYHKPTTFFSDDITLLINYKNRKREIIFYDNDINTINRQLKDIVMDSTDKIANEADSLLNHLKQSKRGLTVDNE